MKDYQTAWIIMLLNLIAMNTTTYDYAVIVFAFAGILSAVWLGIELIKEVKKE